ncbi:hypothetical protein H4R35_000818 [Dimargaris xerosporica]|nr:hypothetical protein H4R35_000818 [Dimargaris xerosporica]
MGPSSNPHVAVEKYYTQVAQSVADKPQSKPKAPSDSYGYPPFHAPTNPVKFGSAERLAANAKAPGRASHQDDPRTDGASRQTLETSPAPLQPISEEKEPSRTASSHTASTRHPFQSSQVSRVFARFQDKQSLYPDRLTDPSIQLSSAQTSIVNPFQNVYQHPSFYAYYNSDDGDEPYRPSDFFTSDDSESTHRGPRRSRSYHFDETMNPDQRQQPGPHHLRHGPTQSQGRSARQRRHRRHRDNARRTRSGYFYPSVLWGVTKSASRLFTQNFSRLSLTSAARAKPVALQSMTQARRSSHHQALHPHDSMYDTESLDSTSDSDVASTISHNGSDTHSDQYVSRPAYITSDGTPFYRLQVADDDAGTRTAKTGARAMAIDSDPVCPDPLALDPALRRAKQSTRASLPLPSWPDGLPDLSKALWPAKVLAFPLYPLYYTVKHFGSGIHHLVATNRRTHLASLPTSVSEPNLPYAPIVNEQVSPEENSTKSQSDVDAPTPSPRPTMNSTIGDAAVPDIIPDVNLAQSPMDSTDSASMSTSSPPSSTGSNVPPAAKINPRRKQLLRRFPSRSHLMGGGDGRDAKAACSPLETTMAMASAATPASVYSAASLTTDQPSPTSAASTASLASSLPTVATASAKPPIPASTAVICLARSVSAHPPSSSSSKFTVPSLSRRNSKPKNKPSKLADSNINATIEPSSSTKPPSRSSSRPASPGLSWSLSKSATSSPTLKPKQPLTKQLLPKFLSPLARRRASVSKKDSLTESQ